MNFKKLLATSMLAGGFLLAGCSAKPAPAPEVDTTEKTDDTAQTPVLQSEAQELYDSFQTQLKEEIGTTEPVGVGYDTLVNLIKETGKGETDAKALVDSLNLDYTAEAVKTVNVILKLSADQTKMSVEDIAKLGKQTGKFDDIMTKTLGNLGFTTEQIDDAMVQAGLR